jgi:hypothetical protein
MIRRWVCSECGDVIQSGCTHPPRVCEACQSVLSFREITDRKTPLEELKPVRVTTHDASAHGAKTS